MIARLGEERKALEDSTRHPVQRSAPGTRGKTPGQMCCHVGVSDFSRRQGEAGFPSLVRGAETQPLQGLYRVPMWGTAAVLNLGDVEEEKGFCWQTGSLHLRSGSDLPVRVTVLHWGWGMLWHSNCVTCKQQELFSLG